MSSICYPSLAGTNTGTIRFLAQALIDFQRASQCKKGLKIYTKNAALAQRFEDALPSLETAFDDRNETQVFTEICKVMDSPLVVL